MAAEGELEQEVVVHRHGYEGFIRLMKWGAILSVIAGLVVILIIRQ